jgi:hypothetical protein
MIIQDGLELIISDNLFEAEAIPTTEYRENRIPQSSAANSS